jgi:glucose/arabinose dehydrogenase
MNRVLFAWLGMLACVVFALTPQPLRAAPSTLPAGFSRVALGSGLNGPTAMAFKGSKIFVTEKTGAIRIVRANGVLRAAPWAVLHVSTESERGLLGIALDPDFATNGFVYVYYTTGPGAKKYSGTPENRVSRLKRRVNKPGVQERILLDHIPSTNGNHNGGDIHFGFDGKLYISVGESGCCPNDAQGLNTLRGKILRLNRDGTIPTDNPFYNTPNARQETFAYGFRNPWRFTMRASNQSYIVADVGQDTWEEIDSLQAGANYGWPLYEGPCPSSNLNCNPATVNYGATTPPIHWYNHSSGAEQGFVIAGGVFAENSNYPAPYADAYFYGDGAGWVHTLTLDASNQVTARNDFDDSLAYPVAFGRGPDGNVYVADYGGDIIYKYVYAP